MCISSRILLSVVCYGSVDTNRNVFSYNNLKLNLRNLLKTCSEYSVLNVSCRNTAPTTLQAESL